LMEIMLAARLRWPTELEQEPEDDVGIRNAFA